MEIIDFPEVSDDEWAAATGEPTREQQNDLVWLDSADGVAWCMKKMPKGLVAPKGREREIITRELKANFTVEEARKAKRIMRGGPKEEGDFHYLLIWLMPGYHTAYSTHVNHYYQWLVSGRPWAHSERLGESLMQTKMRDVCLTIARCRQNARRKG